MVRTENCPIAKLIIVNKCNIFVTNDFISRDTLIEFAGFVKTNYNSFEIRYQIKEKTASMDKFDSMTIVDGMQFTVKQNEYKRTA